MPDRPTAEPNDSVEQEEALRRGAVGTDGVDERAREEGDLPEPAGGAALGEDQTTDPAVAAPGTGDPVGDSTEEVAASLDDSAGRSRGDLLEALAEAERQRDEYLDDLRRSQAEFQNYRKRAMREGSQQREQGATEVLARIVEVVDDFELAVIAADSAQDVESLRKGVEMVYGKLVDVLRSFGMEKIGQEGVPFDPERHDAVQQIEDGESREEPVVVEVLRPGYMVGERVVRPAMVKVAR